MIILDKPYISPFLEQTLVDSQTPVLLLKDPQELGLTKPLNYVDASKFIKLYESGKDVPLYTNSENSLKWIMENISNDSLKELIQLFKDKYKFRESLQSFYPDYKFKLLKLHELEAFDVSSFPKPFIIKPNVGFLSLSVYFISDDQEWPEIIKNIQNDVIKNKDIFPTDVVDISEFIIEEAYEGEEFAVDAYFDKNGKPIIHNIYHHYHFDIADTGDRLYYTSKDLFEQFYDKIYSVLVNIQNATKARLFPTHLELRLDKQNHFGIIEANPLRFAGFCVGDLAWFAYKINPYLNFFNQTSPDWEKIHQDRDLNEKFAFILGDLPNGINSSDVKEINYEKFKQKFSNALEVRKINFQEYPLFAIAFVKFTEQNQQEMDEIMQDNFKDVIVRK